MRRSPLRRDVDCSRICGGIPACGRLALFGVMLLAAGCGGDPSNPKAPEIAQAVLERGGKVVTTARSKVVESAGDLPAEPYDITKVDFSGRQISRADLEQLQELKRLRALTLYRTNVTDTAIDLILPIKSLRELELSYTRITDEGLQKLSELPNLEKVFVRGTPLTDEALIEFSKTNPHVKIID